MFTRFLRNVVFNPVFLSEFCLNKSLKSEINKCALKGKRVLDLGCGEQQYKHLFEDCEYIGVDVPVSGRPMEMKKADLFFDGFHLPFKSGVFDFVLCTQVLEHASDPTALMQEIRRVCKLNGHAILSMPFVYPEHEVPYDFQRYTEFGVRELAKCSGFGVKSLSKDTGNIEVLAVLTSLFIINSLVPSIKWLRPVVAALCCFPIQVVGMTLSYFLPDRLDLYLNVIVHLEKNDDVK